MLLSITHSPTGVIHLIAASLSLAAGAAVLLLPKGTLLHRRIGYVYTVAMVVMLVTSFMIYHLYGSFAVFHWLAVVSTLTLLGGMVPMLLRKPKNYIGYHIAFMYWSVIGVFMAFVAESAARIPREVVDAGGVTNAFYYAVGAAGAIVAVLANVYWYRMKKVWLAAYGLLPDEPETAG